MHRSSLSTGHAVASYRGQDNEARRSFVVVVVVTSLLLAHVLAFAVCVHPSLPMPAAIVTRPLAHCHVP